MTQALNLANFANNLNTSGATSNAGLQNSSVTVTAGTGMSGGGAVALGASITLTNAGVTSVTGGTGISVSASTGGITITNSNPGGGGVTSLNGQTGAITNTSIDTIGSYVISPYAVTIPIYSSNSVATNATTAGSNLRYGYSTATSHGINSGSWIIEGQGGCFSSLSYIGGQSAVAYTFGGTALSGTWRCMSTCGGWANYDDAGTSASIWTTGLFVRIS